MNTSNSKKSGFTLPLAMLVAVVIAILALSMANTVRNSSKGQVVFDGMTDAYRVAEATTVAVMGQLAVNGNAFNSPNQNFGPQTASVKDSNGRTVATNLVQGQVLRRDFDNLTGGYYIMTSVTHTVGSHKYSCRLHTYARVSNVGDYFAAINDKLEIASPPVDLTDAKIYGRYVTFNLGGTGATVLKSAEYRVSVTPAANDNSAYINGTPPIQIADNNHRPKQLTYDLLFPQLLDSDLQRYQKKAHMETSKRHNVCDFRNWVDIYPPGYNGTVDSLHPDPYNLPPYLSVTPSTTTMGHNSGIASNADHVFYCPAQWGDMYIGRLNSTTVHGQVLFVAENDIHITGNLVVQDLTTNPNGVVGTTSLSNPGASTAHQAILLTRGNVYIDNTMVTLPATQRIQALIFTPQGTIAPATYASDAIHNQLSLEFTGSMILASQPKFSEVFKASRVYRYMESLGTNPAVDLPALSQIYYSLEEVTGDN
jgi:hypothetical protein